MIPCGAVRYIVSKAVDMLKLISFWCVLAVALVVVSTTPVTLECDEDPEAQIKPNISQAPWSRFDSLTDAANENEEVNPESDDDLDPESEEANDSEMISPSIGQRIVGGSSADISEHPYQVSVLQLNIEYITLCDGSIITSQLVLTAARCARAAPSELTVRAGSNYRNSGGEYHQVTYIHRHPKTKRFPEYIVIDYDVVVMRIRDFFTYGPNIKPIPLATVRPVEGVEATVAGWGRTSTNGSLSRILLAVKLPIISRETCRKDYGKRITDSMICAGYPQGGRSACYGDAGGALVSGGEQVGIVSWGLECAKPNKPSVFVDVAAVRPWIQGVIALYDK